MPKRKFSKKFDDFVDFLHFTHEFREVTRSARVPYGKRFENDAEHSCQLAMMAWYVIEEDKLKLNKELCFMYALAHDLVEIYAGDTFIFDEVHAKSKHAREKEALKKIKKRFPNFKSLTKIIENYEKRVDKESVFIYALDKVLTPLQIYLEDGKLWKERGVSLERLEKNKNHKIALSKDVNKYWRELLGQIIKEQKKLFP